MQFLVYLTVLMVSISTVLLEIHWLTTPAPQPKPAIQASTAPPRPRIEGPNTELSPIYPRKVEQAQPAPVQQSDTGSASIPAVKAEAVRKPAAETTGASTRGDDSNQPAAVVAAPQGNQRDPQTSAPQLKQQTPEPKQQQASAAMPKRDEVEEATASNNRCDVQTCSSSYKSFRASDCTYQPFDGPRRVCGKAPEQRADREQRDEPQRRSWSRREDSREMDRRTRWRVYDEDDDDEADDTFLFRRSRRW